MASQGLTTNQWAVVLVLLAVFAYGPAFTGGFIWDDDDYVQNNLNLRTTRGLAKTWLEPRSSPQYYPLVHTSYWLEYQLWDLWPAGYHATNVCLHAASALLLWRLLLLLELPGAWVAAAVFALHPVHVESVAWITERKNTLSLVFYLAAAYCFLRRELMPPERRSWTWYFAALLSFLAALLSKSVTATLPCALLVVLWWKQGTLLPRQVALVAPMLLLAAPLGLHTAWLERHHVGAVGPEWDWSLVERCLIAGRAVWFYAGKLVVPYPLAFMYPRWEIDERDWRQFVFPVSACLLVAILFLLRKRIGRGPLAAALLFGGTLFPALGFFNIYPMKFSFVADHFQYAASISFIVLVVCGGAWMLARQGLAAVGQLLACGLVVALAILTWRQGLIYADQETLWRDTLAKNPRCDMAYLNLARWLQSEKRYAEAMDAYEGAIHLKPGEPDARIGLAMVHAARQDLDEAERILRETIPLRPDYALTYSNLAEVLYRREQPHEAERLFQRALNLDGKNSLIRFNYGNLLFKQHREPEAAAQYEQVLRDSPDSVGVRYALAVAHLIQGKREIATAELRAVLETDPKHEAARELLEQVAAGGDQRRAPVPEAVKRAAQ